jgi:prophage maintenance system killer protein
MIHYPAEQDFQKKGFPFIQEVLSAHERAPDYLSEKNGMAELNKVLSFVQQDEYYPSFTDKAAYLVCSLSGSQYFSNGNKRLAVTSLLLFLSMNNAEIYETTEERYAEILQIAFPAHVWEHNEFIKEPHSLFLYNLAIVVGTRQEWGTHNFGMVRDLVGTLFSHLYSIGKS